MRRISDVSRASHEPPSAIGFWHGRGRVVSYLLQQTSAALNPRLPHRRANLEIAGLQSQTNAACPRGTKVLLCAGSVASRFGWRLQKDEIPVADKTNGFEMGNYSEVAFNG